MSVEIPFHIQAEIIQRLPVASLLKFRSVSQAWKCLIIDSSDFMAAHSPTQPQQLLIRYQDLDESAEKYVSFLDDDTFPQQRFVHTLPQSIKLLNRSRIIGSSHGLLCFHGFYEERKDSGPNVKTEMVVLWNPSIRKSLAVAVPKNIDPDADYTVVGFHVFPDPKIIVIKRFCKISNHCEAKVYTGSSGKWRLVSSNLLSKAFGVLLRRRQVVVARFIYWCAFDPPAHNLIISFDTTNETFGVVDLPDSLSACSPLFLSISKLRESLVVLEYVLSSPKHAFVVWMMENGVQKPFTKLFTIDAPYYSKVLGFRTNGQAIIQVYKDYKLSQSKLVVCDKS